METTLDSEIKWSFWLVVFSLTMLPRVYASNTCRMTLQGFITYNYADVNVDGPEHPPNYPPNLLGDPGRSGSLSTDPRKPAARLAVASPSTINH